MMNRVRLLSDGLAMADGGGAFGLVPRPRWMKLLPPDDQNRVPQALWCVLVEADGQRILIDTGAGDKSLDKLAVQYGLMRDGGTLMDALSKLGLTPGDIDIVIQTHLHGDHCGWATCLPDAARETSERLSDAELVAQAVPTFRNARYFAQRIECDDATHPNERTRNTYFAENFVPLARHGVLTLLDGEARITESVRVLPTPGHTAGHQAVVIESVEAVDYPLDGELVSVALDPPRTVVMLGDLTSYMVNLERLAWVTAYDVLPLVTIDTKRGLQKWLAQTRAIVISAHDTRVPCGELVADAKGFYAVKRLTPDPITAT